MFTTGEDVNGHFRTTQGISPCGSAPQHLRAARSPACSNLKRTCAHHAVRLSLKTEAQEQQKSYCSASPSFIHFGKI